jgi:hypothetical protein
VDGRRSCTVGGGPCGDCGFLALLKGWGGDGGGETKVESPSSPNSLGQARRRIESIRHEGTKLMCETVSEEQQRCLTSHSFERSSAECGNISHHLRALLHSAQTRVISRDRPPAPIRSDQSPPPCVDRLRWVS